MTLCPVCKSETFHAFSATVLRKHEVCYVVCGNCGLLQTEKPYWLAEAYTTAIAAADTGLVQRNISTANKLTSLIYFGLSRDATCVDVAGGYGMLTRLMRDVGFDFYWSDEYCQNLLAIGFEADKAGAPFAALTAFEVLEHVPDPLAFIKETMKRFGSRTLIFSTLLYEGSPPAKDWWYYAFSTGQHISFYSKKTLLVIARQLGLNLYSAHGLHMLTDRPMSQLRFSFLTGRISYLLSLYSTRKMKSRTMSDHERMVI